MENCLQLQELEKSLAGIDHKLKPRSRPTKAPLTTSKSFGAGFDSAEYFRNQDLEIRRMRTAGNPIQ